MFTWLDPAGLVAVGTVFAAFLAPVLLLVVGYKLFWKVTGWVIAKFS